MKKLKKLKIRNPKNLFKHLCCNEAELTKIHEGIRDDTSRYYTQWYQTTKGKKRAFAKPKGRLVKILDNLKKLLQRIELPDSLHGGIKGRSPVTNAYPHIGKPAILKFDIADFFPGIRPYRVYNMFCERLECSASVSCCLTRLVTLHGGLPQGSPTSTVIANLMLVPVVKRIEGLAGKHRCDFTQFVDDGSISGPAYIERLRATIEKILQQNGFVASPKPHKRITQYRNEEQVVTGIKVNKEMDVPKGKYLAAKSLIEGSVMAQNKHLKATLSIQGKIQHIKSINPRKGKALEKEFSDLKCIQHYY